MFTDESGVSIMEKSKGTEKLKKIPKDPAEVGDLLSEESSLLDGGICSARVIKCRTCKGTEAATEQG